MLLPTTVVGSYSVPEWLERLKTEYYQRRISAQHLAEIHEVAIKAAVKDQELAGIDIVSDGELRRDNDVDYFLARIPGVQIPQRAKTDYFDYYDAEVTRPLPELPGGAQTSPGLGLADDFRFTRQLTDKPVKFSFTGPFSLSRRIRDEAYAEPGELVRALARRLNAEARELAEAGADLLQIDEPFLAGYPEQVELAVEAVNIVTEGVPVTWALHVCYGNRYARPSWEGHYDFLFPAVKAARVDQIVLEFARKGLDDLRLIQQHGWDKWLGLGVIDVKSSEVEPAELVASRIRRALDYVPADRLMINPDCGLRHLAPEVARQKLRAMVAGVALVRAELVRPESSQRTGRRHPMSSAGDGFLFTSESVTEGHPDKVADQISDAIVDAALTEDPGSRVAVETLLTTGLVVLAGEITTNAVLDFAAIARRVICEIGYDTGDFGFDGHAVGVITALDRQSPDIARGVAESHDMRAGSTDPFDSAGAGDQGMMFGYATNETPELMPMPIVLAHKLARRLAQVRRNGLLPYLRPDGKTQVTVRYDSGGKPVGVEKVLISTQHEDGVEPKLADALWEQVVTQALPPGLYDAGALRKEFYVNPTGRFVIGGPVGDTGLTGRKIIVDTYGGFARHGGGAFSGKDPSKVDRSASYAARHVAKNIVAAGLADRAEVQVAYAIGVARPLSLLIETFGTEKIDRPLLARLVRDHFDLRPAALVEALNLRRPIYRQTAAYGHFGRDEPGFTWRTPTRPPSCAPRPASARAAAAVAGHREAGRRRTLKISAERALVPALAQLTRPGTMDPRPEPVSSTR